VAAENRFVEHKPIVNAECEAGPTTRCLGVQVKDPRVPAIEVLRLRGIDRTSCNDFYEWLTLERVKKIAALSNDNQAPFVVSCETVLGTQLSCESIR
jgi:hypothetical protein